MSKKKIIIISLSLVFIILLFSLMLIGGRQTTKTIPPHIIPSPTPVFVPFASPTTIPSPTDIPSVPVSETPPPENNPAVIKNENIIPLMPVQTSTYTIEYLVTSDTFLVTVTESPYEQNKALAESWFKDHGIEDLSSIKIIFWKYRWVE